MNIRHLYAAVVCDVNPIRTDDASWDDKHALSLAIRLNAARDEVSRIIEDIYRLARIDDPEGFAEKDKATNDDPTW